MTNRWSRVQREEKKRCDATQMLRKHLIVMPQPDVKKKATVLENTKKNEVQIMFLTLLPEPPLPPPPPPQRLYVFVQYHGE